MQNFKKQYNDISKTWKFIPLCILLIFWLVEPGYTINASFQWDANTEPDLDGYRVFCREQGQSYNYANPSWEGTNTMCTIYDLDKTKTYYFVSRAFDIYGLDSNDSNELVLEPATTSDNRPPIADFGSYPASGIAPLTVNFDGSGSYDPDGEIMSYDWDFGDGTTDMGETVSHTFIDPGVYTVKLTVTDNLSAVDSVVITVLASEPTY